MISLSKLLSKKAEQAADHVGQLLTGIAETAVELEDGNVQTLREKVYATQERITPELRPDEVTGELSTLLDALNVYNRAAEQTAKAQQRELRDIIGATTETIAAIGNSSQSGVQQLKSLETHLESASNVQDLRQMRNKLFACLTEVRNEAARVQADTRMLVRALNAAVVKASAQLMPGTDEITGLPGAAAVEKLLHVASREGRKLWLAMFRVSDMSSINVRFGRDAGNEVLRVVSEQLCGHLNGDVAVHRWNGPTFVAISGITGLERGDLEKDVRFAARSASTVSFAVDGTLRNINVVLSWMLREFTLQQSVEIVCRDLDTFASGEIG